MWLDVASPYYEWLPLCVAVSVSSIYRAGFVFLLLSHCFGWTLTTTDRATGTNGQQRLPSRRDAGSRRCLLGSLQSVAHKASCLPTLPTSDCHNHRQATATELESDNDNDDDCYQTNLRLAILANQCSRRRNATAAREACEILHAMTAPDTISFNTVLKALAKCSPGTIRVPKQSVLRQQQQHHHYTDVAAVSNLTQTIAAADYALELLQHMKHVHHRQWQANQEWYQQITVPSTNTNTTNYSLLSALPTATGGPPRVRVKPNTRTYSTVMDALARVGSWEAAETARDLLLELQQRWRQTRDVAWQPNVITYNTVLTAYAKATTVTTASIVSSASEASAASSGGRGTTNCTMERCLDLLHSMPIAPDVMSYNTALHAMARSAAINSDNGIGERAEQLLHSMTVAPNARSFTTCMDVWSRCGRPDRAYALLHEMLARYNSSQSAALCPNVVSYSTVMHAYAVSKDNDKSTKAFLLLKEMKQQNVTPNAVIFNTLLNCCATSRPHPNLVDMVEFLYQQMVLRKHSNDHDKNTFEPDHYTFGTLLKASSNLYFGKYKPEFAPRVFREACRRGQVSEGVLKQFRQAVPIETFRQLTGSETIDVAKLPSTWTSEVVSEQQQQWKRKRR